MTERIPSDPPITPETEPFWEAAAQNRFLLKKCEQCSRYHWYPRDPCPFCDNMLTDWVEGSGRGTVYSYSHFVRGPVPFIAAFVTLEEGPTMFTNIVDCDPVTLSIGMPVELTFRRSESGMAIPMFTPSPRSDL